MAKSLNFRDFAQPALRITMNDAEETVFTVTTPSVALVEELEANKQHITNTFQRGDKTCLGEIWALAASLISCNREGCKVTADDLKGRYGMNYLMLYSFLEAYGEFIAEIEAAKN